MAGSMMFIECIAIIAVIGILIFMVARTGRRPVAWSILPLLIVPFCYLCSAPLSKVFDPIFPIFNRMTLAIAITVVGLVVACVLFGMLCGNFRSRRARRGYLIMCGGFSTILAVVLIYNVIVVLG